MGITGVFQFPDDAALRLGFGLKDVVVVCLRLHQYLEMYPHHREFLSEDTGLKPI